MHSIYFYRDQDGDTYGNVADFVTNYTGIAPTGYVSNSTDCNDNNSMLIPVLLKFVEMVLTITATGR